MRPLLRSQQNFGVWPDPRQDPSKLRVEGTKDWPFQIAECNFIVIDFFRSLKVLIVYAAIPSSLAKKMMTLNLVFLLIHLLCWSQVFGHGDPLLSHHPHETNPEIFLRIAHNGSAVTDKVTTHQYHEMYGIHLLPLIKSLHAQNKPVKLLEIGLGCGMPYGTGVSADLWMRMLKETDEIWEGMIIIITDNF